MNRNSIIKSPHALVWCAFLLIAAIFSLSLILKIELIPRSAQKAAFIVLLSGFLFSISAVEIFTGEIHTRWDGPPKATRSETPTSYWSQIIIQLLIALGLLSVLIFRA